MNLYLKPDAILQVSFGKSYVFCALQSGYEIIFTHAALWKAASYQKGKSRICKKTCIFYFLHFLFLELILDVIFACFLLHKNGELKVAIFLVKMLQNSQPIKRNKIAIF